MNESHSGVVGVRHPLGLVLLDALLNNVRAELLSGKKGRVAHELCHHSPAELVVVEVEDVLNDIVAKLVLAEGEGMG